MDTEERRAERQATERDTRRFLGSADAGRGAEPQPVPWQPDGPNHATPQG
jgi:hypothetical protein